MRAINLRMAAVLLFLNMLAALPLSAQSTDAEKDNPENSQTTRRQQTLNEEQQRRLAKLAMPLTRAQRAKALQDLKSGDVEKIKKMLKTLAAKNVRPDEEIAKAIMPLLQHRDSLIKYDAKKAIDKFAPDFQRKKEIYQAYYHGLSLRDKHLGKQVTDKTPLPQGLIIAVKEHGFSYYPAMVLNASGENVLVIIRFMKQRKTVKRPDIRLAPPELEQPHLNNKALLGKKSANRSAINKSDSKASASKQAPVRKTRPPTVAEQGYRPWTDDTGDYVIVAKYVGADDEAVTLLRKKDGREVKVPLARLSADDREVAQRLMSAPKPSNPFD